MALAATAQWNDTLFACDTFAERGVGVAPRTAARAFRHTLHRALGDKGYNPSRLALLRRSSLTLSDWEPLPPAIAALPPFRILSVDGAHLELAVFSDLRWAAHRLAPGGILVLNDILHPRWLGVNRGLRSFFQLLDPKYMRLRPLLLSAKKLYLTTPSHHRLYLRALCQLHRDDSLQRRLLPPLPRVAPLKIARLPLSVLSRALAASEPSFNGSGLDAPFAERTLPAAYLPPIERGSLDVAVSRAALRRLSRVLGVRPAAAFRYSSACHMTVIE